MIGFAGFYDAYPWLSFAPFDFSLAIGPLLFFYVTRLDTGALPPRWAWHFLPALVETAYTLVAFSLPLPAKNAWDAQVHAPYIDPLEAVASMLSLAAYLCAAWRVHARYQAWLAAHVSDRDDHRQPWIPTMLAALGLWLVVTFAFDMVDWFAVSLTYADRFWQYLAFAAIVLLIGLESWRHAAHRFPSMAGECGAERSANVQAGVFVATADVAPAVPPARQEADSVPAPALRDWQATADAWEARMRAERWWQEPGLTLAQVAARLGTNDSYVSRAFNTGQGRNFNAVVNAMRVESVQARLRRQDGADLLTIALESGFASKASFNRVFRELTGQTPSAWRTSQVANPAPNPENEATAGGAPT